MSHMITV